MLVSLPRVDIDVDVDVSLDGDGDERASEGVRAADVYTNHNRQTEQAQSTIYYSYKCLQYNHIRTGLFERM